MSTLIAVSPSSPAVDVAAQAANLQDLIRDGGYTSCHPDVDRLPRLLGSSRQLASRVTFYEVEVAREVLAKEVVEELRRREYCLAGPLELLLYDASLRPSNQRGLCALDNEAFMGDFSGLHRWLLVVHYNVVSNTRHLTFQPWFSRLSGSQLILVYRPAHP